MNSNKLALRAMALAVGVGLAAGQARAETVTLTFDEFPNSVDNAVDFESYFDGGSSSLPQLGTGPNYGLVFSANANEQLVTTTNPPPKPGTGKFENNPSGLNGVLYFPFSATSAGYMNSLTGFTTLSFYYSLLNNSSNDETTVDVYSGLNGTGTLLDSLLLSPSSTPVACKRSFDEFCSWSFASLTTSTEAESAVFTAQGDAFSPEFDLLSVNVPEPATWAMMLTGLFGLGATLHGRRRATSATA
jgi:hypothetical protein